jgi:ElaB/YqjD/DUF883 family membrane-anchored ribosome-binding protein
MKSFTKHRIARASMGDTVLQMKENHTFPVPEVEAHKLDDLEEQLQDHAAGLATAVKKFLRENAWASTAVALALGFLIARQLVRRRH